MTDWEQRAKELMEGRTQLPDVIKGKIIDCTMTTAGAAFGDSVKFNPENGETLESAKAKEMLKVLIDTGYEFDIPVHFFISMHRDSNMGKFTRRYGSVPKVGIEVTMVRTPSKKDPSRSFYNILL